MKNLTMALKKSNKIKEKQRETLKIHSDEQKRQHFRNLQHTYLFYLILLQVNF